MLNENRFLGTFRGHNTRTMNTNCESMASIPQSVRVLARGVRKVIAGLTGLLQPSFISDHNMISTY
jgi:hypothetical protein